MLLDVNLEKTHLRIRTREENSSDNENDGFKSNFVDIFLKLTDITRLEVGREKTSKKSIPSSKQVKSFSIVMRKPVGESNTFNFEAESPGERDLIIGGIKSVLEQTKIPSEHRRRRSTQSPQLQEVKDTNFRTTSNSWKESVRESDKEKELITGPGAKFDDIAGNAAVYFDFDLPNDGPEAAIEAEMRHDTSARNYYEEQDFSPESYDDDERAKSSDFAITVIETTARRETSIEVAGIKWSVDDILCGIAIGGHTSPRESSPTNSERALHGNFGSSRGLCNPLDGCDSKALTAVEDIELTNVSANEISAGPFCTDDVCTASLKDFTDTMKGIFEMKQHSREGQPEVSKQRTMAEDYITGVLGAPTTVAANLLSVKDMWSVVPEKKTAPKKRTLQNRSRNRGSQAARLTRLRRQMTFTFTANTEKIPYVQVVSSYDDVDRGGRFGRKLKSGQIAKGDQHDSSVFLRMVVDNMELSASSSTDEEILYYDSDPEDARESAIRRGPRRAIADRDNISKRTTPIREALSEIPTSRLINLTRRLRRVDDELVNEIIDTMKNEKMTLLWHPTQSGKNPNRVPFCSKVWIESGIYLIDGTFLLPKLTWVPVFEESIQSKVLNVTLRNPGTIDLLDVCRVRECDKIDRNIHPFANLDHSFVVQTQKEIHLFEARSKGEKIRIVNGLRLVIARLASLLMLRDLRAVDEFFGGNSVPGEAPTWAQGKTDGSNS